MNPPIETTRLSKRYQRAVAVDQLDLTVRSGEVYGFLGPNGAGKTTTLRMLLGLIRPSSGSARVLGETPGSRRHLPRVGALIEGPAFYPHLSGRVNLNILARYSGSPRTRVDEVLETVALSDRARDRYSSYSLGMKQRLGVAAALLKQPRLLILDEPTNGLDPAGMADMRSLIRELGAQGRTVLLSSHLLAEVQQVCDRVGIIAHGRLVAEATVNELRATGTLRVSADPADKAAAVASDLLGASAVTVHDGSLVLRAAPEQAASINTALVTAGVAVSRLTAGERDLEEVFFALTGKEMTDVE